LSKNNIKFSGTIIKISTKLEKLQLDAARIVTGLQIFTKTDKLYSETGWTTLSSRRHNRKLYLTVPFEWLFLI
jgi:hypothetical protein